LLPAHRSEEIRTRLTRCRCEGRITFRRT
jgi:hypothetical protein